MTWMKRALCYIRRKRIKTFLLFLIFFVSVFAILGAWSVLYASDQVGRRIKENSNSKVTMESMDQEQMLDAVDVDAVKHLQNIVRINRVSEIGAYANGFPLVEGSEEGEAGRVTIHGYDDMKNDSPFEEQICRLVEGREVKGKGEIVINQVLAECGQIKIGDELSFLGKEGQHVSAVVVGFYLTGNENSQTDAVHTENRMENQVYADTGFVLGLSGKEQYQKIAVYVADPDSLKQTAQEMEQLFADKANVGTLDTVYQKLKYSIQQIERVTRLMFTLIGLTSVFIIGSLLCMWMRNRKTEIAVYFSMGLDRKNVFAQMCLECILLFTGAAAAASVIGLCVFPAWISGMDAFQGQEIRPLCSAGNLLSVWGIGTGLLVVLVGMASAPYFRKQLKDILSEMEG